MDVGLLYSRIRRDEKLLLGELRDRGHTVQKVDVRRQQFDIHTPPAALADVDVVLDRCLATSRSVYLSRLCEAYGLPVINSGATAMVCADKLRTSVALAEAGVPTPRTSVAFSVDSALETIEAFGYPCVLKPVMGSWGRLMAKIDSRDAAEAILEHKAVLGHYEHKVFYLQEYVDKPDRDLRVVVTDGEPIAAMARSGEHWITNAAVGAETTPYVVSPAVAELAAAASDAVGGGLLGVDLMETDAGPLVHEVNHTVEFKALDETVDVDVPAAVVDWIETRVVEAAA
ncbi:MAG: lysine biosynthesis protein LysX [Haloferacaceae archaeon]|nr:lysine biosynthesis protein LysX [Haloferacaceae archaeon]